MSKIAKIFSVFILCTMIQGCLGAIVGTTADVAIEVAKVPFKVGGAVIDVVTGDGSSKDKRSRNKTAEDEGDDES